MTLKQFKQHLNDSLSPIYPTEEINSFFSLLLNHYLQMELKNYYQDPDKEIAETDVNLLKIATDRLKQHEPIQYVIGYTRFFDLDIAVNPHVLIPRPETEELTDWFIRDHQNNQSLTLMDVATGSGAIALALKNYLHKATVFGWDISEKAINIANKNAAQLHLDVQFQIANILDPPDFQYPLDAVISNPPYVRMSEKQHMRQNVLNYEPGIALFVTDEQPLIFYEAIIEFALKHLKNDGWIYLEINEYLGHETALLLENSNFTEIEIKNDIHQKPRMLKGKLSLF